MPENGYARMAGFEYCIRINHLDCVPSMLSWHSACNAVGADVSGADAHDSDREYYWQYFGNAPQGLCAARGLNSAYLEILSSFYSFVLMAFTVSTIRDLKKNSVMWYMSELFHSLGHRCPAVL